jgi:hypothetical protein
MKVKASRRDDGLAQVVVAVVGDRFADAAKRS